MEKNTCPCRHVEIIVPRTYHFLQWTSTGEQGIVETVLSTSKGRTGAALWVNLCKGPSREPSCDLGGGRHTP